MLGSSRNACHQCFDSSTTKTSKMTTTESRELPPIQPINIFSTYIKVAIVVSHILISECECVCA